MAETTQKPKTKKSRVPKTQPTPEEVIFSEVPEVEELPEIEKVSEVEENLPEENLEEEIPAEILENIEAEVPEISTESPGNSKEVPENFKEDLTESPGDVAAAGAHLYKLRPDLPDDKSKWAVQIQTGPRSYHRIFEGSLVRARNRAFRWNLRHNLPNIKINQISK